MNLRFFEAKGSIFIRMENRYFTLLLQTRGREAELNAIKYFRNEK